ncbi:MAG: 4-hydroxy-3-methylbut-2-enyl diphosphate reductase [Bacillota bacterium]
MEVIKITPRGYCYGVVDAVSLARNVASDPNLPRPIYILGQIVHNRHTVEELERLGVQTMDGADRLQLIAGIDHGTVIFTAHGVSPAVRIEAARKGLKTIDATCPDVTRTHDLIRELAAQDYYIVYVGKKGHPEPEGAMGEAPDRVLLVENQADVAAVDLDVPRLAVVTQTTLSQWDTQAIIESIRARYPHAQVHNEICLATQQRQEAVATQGREADLVLVVGDERSNNSNRLVQVAREIAGRPAYLVGTAQDIDPAWLKGKRKVAVTSGTSTPTHITRDVIQFLEDYQPEP